MAFSASPVALGELRVRHIEPSSISDADCERWHDLARRSCHSNPFLLPEFVLPSCRCLGEGLPLSIVVVDDPAIDRWLAVVAVSRFHRRWDLPSSHATALRTSHTFRTGPLVDGDRVAEALDCLLGALAQLPWARHGLVLTNFRLETTLAAELQAAARRGGYGWQVTEQRPSPAVFPGVVDAEYLDSVWSASRRKAIRRAYRKLEAYGPLRLRLITDAAEIPRSVDRFLELERNSWKGTAKTALASTPSDKAFVEEMVVGMAARGNVVMSELLVGERVAAAAINLVMGEVLCAFKIGWSLELARASPGMVHEVELMRRFAGPLAGYSLLDGCTNPESYLSRLWPSRIPVGTVVIGTSSRARMMMAFATFARSIKRSGRQKSEFSSNAS